MDTARLELSRAVDAGDLDEVLRLAWMVHRSQILALLRTAGLSVHQCEEAVQEVFATVYVEWHRFDGRSLRDWLLALARCEARTVIKADQRSRRPAEVWVPPSFEVEERVASLQQLRAVAEFRASLSPVDRRILDSPLTTTSMEQLRASLSRELGVQMSATAIWSKRMEIRQLLYLHTGREAADDC